MREGMQLTVISQTNSRIKGPNWLLDYLGLQSLGAPSKSDLIRELHSNGALKNMLAGEGNEGETESVPTTLDDFELLTVLGRGGFGKVMQVICIMSIVMYIYSYTHTNSYSTCIL